MYSLIQRAAYHLFKGTVGRGFGSVVSEAVWQSAIKQIHSTSICVRHGLLQFKIIHRLHYSRSKLARIFPEIDPTCSRCHREEATLGHIFWTCPAQEPPGQSDALAFSSAYTLTVEVKQTTNT